MLRWHLVYRNKVADSNLEEPVEKLASSQDSEIAEAAAQVSYASLEFVETQLTSSCLNIGRRSRPSKGSRVSS